MKRIFEVVRSAVLAGMAISMGCVVNVKVGGWMGPVLFSFGLLTVVHYKMRLYTGTAGFIRSRQDFADLLWILLGNALGCLLMAGLAWVALPEVAEGCLGICAARLARGAGALVVLGGLCGFIMTTAVEFGREGRFLPLLFGVPLFIMAGFCHSIADAFYLLVALLNGCDGVWNVLWAWLLVVLGNFIGCNFYRLVMWKWK